MTLRDEVLARWQRRHDEWQKLGVTVNGAMIVAEVIADLRAILEGDSGELLPLAEAARESGYSADHLARLVRESRIPNAGRRGKPMIRRCDLPVRPPKLEGQRLKVYDPVA